MSHLGSLLVVYENPIYNINRFVFQELGDVVEGLSDCEELVILKKMNIQYALMK